MKLLFCSLVAIGLLSMDCIGQTAPVQATNTDFAFFNHLFKTIADPMEDPSGGKDATIFPRREQTEITRYGLNQSEASVLHAAAQTYYGFAVQMEQQVSQIASGNSELSATDREALSNLESQRRSLVLRLATQFLTNATTQTVIRIRYMEGKEIH